MEVCFVLFEANVDKVWSFYWGQFFLKNGPTPASFSFIYCFSKHTLQFLQQLNVKKCPSSIWCRDSNSRPLELEPHPITNGPGLLPTIGGYLDRKC